MTRRRIAKGKKRTEGREEKGRKGEEERGERRNGDRRKERLERAKAFFDEIEKEGERGERKSRAVSE